MQSPPSTTDSGRAPLPRHQRAVRERARKLTPEREAAVLDAALAVLGRAGFDGFTLAAVCAASGASSKTVLRRWPDLTTLTAAVLIHAVDRELQRPIAVIEAGDLRSDLVENLQAHARSERAGPRLVEGLLRAARTTGDLGERAQAVLAGHETARCREILSAAVDRGELRTAASAEAVAELSRSFLLHEILTKGTRPTPQHIVAFVDTVILPVLRSNAA
ncbi:TetR-like C-terminal domain-containing protein [Kineosporia babensis]|uniref:TetR/AcrR family transcriptional regulator C-terminal ligand-binding domain-containing protein n=1 Tax=Kineosporia babensis TaxID=499548 RepID=A0A9X1NGA2_9ACTN|nr:TetR-like C-terminal domain-containing protein [Kineosporia babensis]MCD5314437.1 TetR/AcrR family transcriptional regulator C-terminal ligand-binding domain-containing protein [Kineosporia babensis]